MAYRFFTFFFTSIFFLTQTFNAAARSGPTGFIENKGQVTDQHGSSRNDIDFRVPAKAGLNIFIGSGQIHYQWAKAGTAKELVPVAGEEQSPALATLGDGTTEMYRMDVGLIGANPHPAVTTEGPLQYSERYYLPFIKEGTVAHGFSAIVYHDIYPNIDWRFYFNSRGMLEHDFIIRPGGKVSDIRLQYNGTTNLQINGDGSLYAVSPFGEITEHAPYAYRQKDKSKVAASFILSNNILSFSAATTTGTLVIDPTLEWGTYFGGSDYDDITDIILGKDGFIYGTGATNSTSNIATTGAYQTTFAGGANTGGSDAILTKFNKDGQCIWATYYGSTNVDLGRKITADTAGSIYMAGYTSSTSGITTVGSAQPAYGGGGFDAFLIKFDTAGQRIWGTYYGGSNVEASTTMDVAADKFGGIFLTGNTLSTNIAMTAGAWQTANAGGGDAFLTKFNTAGAVLWSTYYGGSSADYPYAIETDNTGNVYMTGRTQSSTGMATSGTQQTTIGGNQDAFLSKFNPSGQLIWGTYYGGSGVDRGYCLTADDHGYVYMGGISLSASGIATSGAHQEAYSGGVAEDGIISKFDSSGHRIWATYYGSSIGADVVSGLFLSNNGSIYASGFTFSSDSIATLGGLQPVFGGASDALMSRFDTSGVLLWGSYYGGIDADVGYIITGDTTGNLYLCGRTISAIQIATSASYQNTLGGGIYDGFLIRFKDCMAPGNPDSISGAANICAGTSNDYIAAIAVNATSYTWILPAGWSGNSATNSITLTNDGTSGIIKVVAVNSCDVSDTVSLSVSVNPLPVMPVINQAGSTLSLSLSYTSYQWSRDGEPIPGATNPTYIMTQNGSYSVTVTNPQGCSVTSDAIDFTATGIDELLALNGITIYPNPVTEAVLINSVSRATAQLTTIDGKLLQALPLDAGVNRISMKGYADGIYLLRVFSVDGITLGIKKIIKSNQ